MAKLNKELKMKVSAIRCINDKPFLTASEISERYSMSTATAKKRIKEIEELRSRYGDFAVIRIDRLLMVNTLAFTDYLANKKQIEDRTARKYLKDYDPSEVARNLGWQQLEKEVEA